MTGRIHHCVARVARERTRLLVLYLTLGDPVLTDLPAIARAAVRAGADVLEVGLPTPHARPRGHEVRQSFERAGNVDTRSLWQYLSTVHEAVQDTPVVPLAYPETVRDLGGPAELAAACAHHGADGLVHTFPLGPGELGEVAAAGLSPIPLIRHDTHPADRRRLEAAASHLTYRNLGLRTGDQLNLDQATSLASRAAASAAKPFLVGFGIRSAREIQALAPHAAGVVVGSEAIRILRSTPTDARAETLATHVRHWKSALEPTVERARA